ncbi:MAG: hypothetical protein L3J39_02070 [Verrucomicrobiales bacterium]|nr:hypothetical protein [Verrucomicrobiales bacterium]
MTSLVKRQRWCRRLRVLALCVVLILASGAWVMGFSDVGVPKVLKKLAQQYSEKGFKLRKEHWNGTLKQGQYKVIKHQLFRGNEYWFLAALSEGEHALAMEVFDEEGHAISLERFSDKGLSGARVLPVKTGTYLIKLSVTRTAKTKKQQVKKVKKTKQSKSADLDWALIYGYR